MLMNVFFSAILGYLVGNINPAAVFSWLKDADIRNKGSGNVGASNALIVMGKGIGLFCALFDIMKAFFVVKLCFYLFPDYPIIGILSGTCCILGHIFPFLMHFHGGKGLAALGGVLLAYNWRMFLIILLSEIILVCFINYVCLVATSASQVFTLILLINSGVSAALVFAPATIAILYRHRLNFVRIRYGVEAKIRYIWDKDSEQKRLQKNWNNLTEEERLIVEMPNPLLEA